MFKQRLKNADPQLAAGRDGLASLGAELRAARTARGEDLTDIASYLRIRPHYLAALEAGEGAALPPRTYAIGFLRAYAQALGLDAEALVARLKASLVPAPMPELVQHEPKVAAGRRPAVSLVAASILLLGGLYVGYRLIGGDAASVPAQVAELSGTRAPVAVLAPESPPAGDLPPLHAAAPEPAAPPAPPAQPGPKAASAPAPSPPAADVSSAVAAEPDPSQPIARLDVDAAPLPARADGPVDGRVVLIARESSWIQVRSATRDWVRTRTLAPGDQLVLPDRTDLALWTGNAGGIELMVDGQSVGRAGAAGAVVRDLPLAPDSLRQRAGAGPP